MGRNLTGLLLRLGAIILDSIRAGAVATIANPNINRTGLKLLATSPTKVAKKPTGEYKKLCTFLDHFTLKSSFLRQNFSMLLSIGSSKYLTKMNLMV
jgi:hypothetical protein